MKLGMPVLFEYDNVEDNLKLLKKLGLDFLEMNLNFGYCRDCLENKYLGELLEKYGCFVTLHFYDEADFGTYPEIAKAWLKLLNKYLSLGKGKIKMLNIHLIDGPVVTISGVKNYMYDKEFESYSKRLLTTLDKATKICNKYNCRMVIENSKTVSYMMKTYELLLNCGRYNFNYDIGHDNCNNGYVLEVLKKHPEMRFSEFHFHDADTVHDHLSLGDGKIDLKFYKDKAVKDDAIVLLEVKSSSDLEKSVPFFNNL